MSERPFNTGTYISGSSINAPIASGRESHAEQHIVNAPVPAGDVTTLTDRLRAVVEEHAALLPEARQALRDIDELRTEATAPDGDRERIRDALRRLARRLQPVGAALGLLADLKELLS